MKKITAAIVTVAAITGLVGASLAQTSAPATTPAPAAAAPAKAPVAKQITGELVGLDKAAKTAIVKYLVDQKPMQMTLSMDEAMFSQVKMGDRVKVTYHEVDGKFVATAIAKV
jgi:Cu/Ag efflux protein CusF